MSEKINVITGATGLLGSHIAEQLSAHGQKVRALVRPTSDVTFLKHLGVQLCFGDLGDAKSLKPCIAGAATLYHCASRVGDFGTWKSFHKEVVATTRNVMEACRDAAVGRILHVSSVAVYGRRPRIPPGGLSEEQPLQKHGWAGNFFGDHYGRAKIMAEELALALCPQATVVRPTWMIGPRDRHGLSRLIQALRGRWVSLVGSGDNLLNILHAADVARGAIRAASKPEARGQIYNLCSAGEVTQRQFLNALCDAEGLPRVTRCFPFRLAYFGGFLGEIIAQLLRFQRAPFISRYTVSRLARSNAYQIDKARTQLDWQPRIKILVDLPRLLSGD